MNNEDVATVLENIADLLELQEDLRFKIQAYRRAAQAIEELQENVNDVLERKELQNIRGIGKAISTKIEELLTTGKLKYYIKLKKKVKVDIENLKKIPALGPKKIKILYKELKVKDIKSLEKVIKLKKVRKLKGFGEKTEKQLQEGIDFLKTKPRRFTYKEIEPIVENIISFLHKIKETERVDVAGSFRRKKATIGDIDILVISKDPVTVMEKFVKMPSVKMVIVKGKTKSSVRLENGLQIDLRVVCKKEYGAALLYFTGSKEHNVALRKLALKKGLTLNEYGLYTVDGKEWVAGKTEKEIYTKLGLKYIEPEKRLNQGEV